MKRQPITTQQSTVAIKMVQSPLTFNELMPSYRYQFQMDEPSEDADEMYSEMVSFFNTNEELAFPSEEVSHRDDYVKGFQKAMALTRLWIDSIYLSRE